MRVDADRRLILPSPAHDGKRREEPDGSNRTRFIEGLDSAGRSDYYISNIPYKD